MSNDKMNPNQEPSDKTPPRKGRQFIMMALTLLSVFFLMSLLSGDFGAEKISRTEFFRMINDEKTLIQELELQKTHDGVVVRGVQLLNGLEEKGEGESSLMGDGNKKIFTTLLLSVADSTIRNWEVNKKLKVDIKHDTSGWLNGLFTIVLPTLIIIGFFWYMMSRQSGPNGGRGIFNFGKSKAKLMDSSKVPVTFRDVAGCDEAKEELTEVVDFLKNPKKYDDLGAKIPKGALLLGPPGTGKTLLARAVAGEAKVPFYSMSGSDFVEMFVGVGASRVRDLFETGKKNAPCIIFIDEIDAVGRQRGAGLGGGHDEREQTLNQLLVEMDGFEGNEGVILIAATNRADVLDKALLRPGRFDRHIVVDAPDAKGREEILKVHVRKRKTPLMDDVDLGVIAKGTPGLSGADIENLVNEAALMAARYNSKKVSMIDFEEAKDKLMIGAERRSRILTEEEKKTTAYHEAGHALVTHLVENSDTLHKLTIIPRGMALGITFSLPEKDRYTMDKAYLEDQIAILLGGRAAEMLIFGQRNTGASNDIERATGIARRMVTEWGMTDELGPIHYATKKSEPFLGRDISQKSEYSEQTAEKIDEVVRGIIEAQMKRVDRILQDNKEKLVALSEALLQHEVLDREEILAVLDEGKTLESTKKSRQFEQMSKVKEQLASGDLFKHVSQEPALPEVEESSEDQASGDKGKGLDEKA